MTKKYNIIYADPPWSYRDKANSGKRGAAHKYDVMNIDDLCKMPVNDLAADDCLLAMWWVPPMPKEALALVEAWGFELKTMFGFTWHKQTVNGLDHFGMGNWTRANQEAVLFATKGKPKRIAKNVRQIIHAKIGEHSAKPPETRDRLIDLMGNVPRLEMFARTKTDGWDCFGNEIKSDIEINGNL